MAGPAVRKLSIGYSALSRIGGLGVLIPSLALLYFLPADVLGQGMIGVIPGVFALGGAFIASWQRGLIVDENARSLVIWSGLIVPMSRTSYPLASLRHVRLVKRILRTGKGPRHLYPVALARRDVADLEIWVTTDYARARRQAEALAKLVALDLHDESTGETVVREARYLDEPLAQRYRRLRLAAPLPQPPQGALARLHPRSARGETLIEMPGTGLRAAHVGLALFLMFAPLLLIGLFGFATWRQDGPSPAFFVVFGGLAAVTVLPTLLIVVHLSTQRERITVSPSGIDVDSGSWVRRNRAHFPAGEIEEIIAPADLRRGAKTSGEFLSALAHSAGLRPVLIRTDKRTTGVGRWTSDVEQRWLRDVLVHALVSSARA